MKIYSLVSGKRTRLIPAWLIILIFGAGLLTYQIHLPYGKWLEHGTLEIRARNFEQEGFWALRFLPTRNIIGGEPNFYLEHPPLFIIILALTLYLLGDSVIAARLLVIACSLGSVFLLYKIVLRQTSVRVALVTAGTAVLTPIFFYYGRIVNYDPFTLLISLLTVWLFLNYPETSNHLIRPALFAAVVIGTLSDWPFYFTPPALLIYALIRKEKRALAAATVLLAVGTYALMIGYYSLAVNRWGGELTVFRKAAPSTSLDFAKNILWLRSDFYIRLAERIRDCFTLIIPFLALAGLLLNIRGLKQRQGKAFALSILLLIQGLGMILIAPSYVYHHDWGLFMLIPAASFLSAQAILKFPPLIRGVSLLIFLLLAAFQFIRFHGSRDFLPAQIGKDIYHRSSPGEIILAPRGLPIGYYSRLPTQFIWPGPSFFRFVSEYKPDWVVFNENVLAIFNIPLDKVHTCLNEGGYRMLSQEGFEVWKRETGPEKILGR